MFRLIGANDIGSPSVEDVIVKTTTDVNPRHRLSLLGILSPERFTRNIDNVLSSPNFDDTLLADSEQDSGLFGATWQWLTSERSYVTNQFFYRRSEKRSTQGESFPELVGGALPRADEVPTRQDILTVAEAEEEIGWRGDVTYVPRPGDSLAIGARVTRVALDFDTRLDGDWTRYVYDQNDFRSDPAQKFIVLQPMFVSTSFRDSAVRAAVYGDYSRQLGARLTVTPGLRWDYDGFSGESLVSPRVNAAVTLSPLTKVNVAAGVFYQHPLFLQLASNPLNAVLRNERSRQLLVGVTRTIASDIRFSAEAYYQSLDRLVVRPDRTTGLAANTGTGHSTGVDLILAKRLVDRWYGQVTYSFQRSRRDDELGDGLYPSDFNRPNIFNALLAYEFSDSWSVGGKWRYATGRPTDDFIVHEDVLGDPSLLRFAKELTANNVRRLPDFHTLNLRVDYRRRVGSVRVITFVDVFNVYGHTNVNSLRWQERTGENVESGLQAFPTFGVKLEY